MSTARELPDPMHVESQRWLYEGGVLVPSTTWRRGKRKITTPPRGHADSGSAATSIYARQPWNPREPLTLKVRFRGGSECWYEVHARGAVVRRPGVIAVHDLMSLLYQNR